MLLNIGTSTEMSPNLIVRVKTLSTKSSWRPSYKFDESCQGTVPESIIAFLDSTDFENAIRLAISLGGDADTMGAIIGGIAEAYYGAVPEHIRKEVIKRLPIKIIRVMQNFYHKFMEK